MPMTAIAGSYRILKSAPDGDSIRFYPNNPQLWQQLPDRVHTNHAGGAQLRLDGIDALETHYQPKGGSLGMQHQPEALAQKAAAELLRFLGFDRVERTSREIITSASPEEVPGYILTRSADMYGRSVAFAFKGEPPADGSRIHVSNLLLRESANYHLLAEGLAYPTFYSKLYVDLRQEMTKAVEKARKAKKGLWKEDKTIDGFTLETLATLTDEVAILPKLFRRLLDYLNLNDGSVSLAGFQAYVESRNDRIIILPVGQVTGFDYIVKVEKQAVRLTVSPEDIVFVEK